jgi:hypothetical protein
VEPLTNSHEREDQALFNRNLTTIEVPGIVIPYLRSGLLAEFGTALDVLDDVVLMDEIDLQRWADGLAQLQRAQSLLETIGVAAGSDEFDISLDDLTPKLARLVRDALRAIYDVEVRRLADAAEERVQLPMRAIPTLRNFLVDTDRRLSRAAKRVEPLFDPSERRTPRTVKFSR